LATLKNYAFQLWGVHRVTCEKLGLSIAGSTAEDRAIVVSTDMTMACLIKALTDKGVLTDPELAAVFTSLRNAAIPPLAVSIARDEEGTPPPDPDLGA
jgi:hypothetical protein